jgi:hypothetical protein
MVEEKITFPNFENESYFESICEVAESEENKQFENEVIISDFYEHIEEHMNEMGYENISFDEAEYLNDVSIDSLLNSVDNGEIYLNNSEPFYDKKNNLSEIIEPKLSKKEIKENFTNSLKDLILDTNEIALKLNSKLESIFNYMDQFKFTYSDFEKGKKIDFDLLRDKTTNNLINENINNLISKNKLIEAHQFEVYKKKEKSSDWKCIKSPQLKEYKNNLIQEISEKIIHGRFNFNKLKETFNDFNHLTHFLNYKKINLDINDLPIKDIVKFEYGGDLENGNVGKVILIHENSKNTLGLYFSKLEYNLTTKNSKKEDLREFFKAHIFNSLAGYHKHIKRPSSSKVLGGGAYKVISKNNIFVDYDSGDFGSMQKEVVKECLKSGGYKLTTLSDDYFKKKDFHEYVIDVCFQ